MYGVVPPQKNYLTVIYTNFILFVFLQMTHLRILSSKQHHQQHHIYHNPQLPMSGGQHERCTIPPAWRWTLTMTITKTVLRNDNDIKKRKR